VFLLQVGTPEKYHQASSAAAKMVLQFLLTNLVRLCKSSLPHRLLAQGMMFIASEPATLLSLHMPLIWNYFLDLLDGILARVC
jgi:hypothetical protein